MYRLADCACVYSPTGLHLRVRVLTVQVELSHDETTEVMRHFDRDNNGLVDYNEFMELVGFKPRATAGGRGGPETPRGRDSRDSRDGSHSPRGRASGPHGDDEEIIDDVLERLRKRISRDLKHGSDMEKVGWVDAWWLLGERRVVI